MFTGLVGVAVIPNGVVVVDVVGAPVSSITILAGGLVPPVGERPMLGLFFTVRGDAWVAVSLAAIKSPVAIKSNARKTFGTKLGRAAERRSA
ncbi:hypothetical protein KSF_025780 [Reticulibacter mediterranei]|uniref:Uncharacterized protein n=1 Tax=Reticulibacter mediterranei TaxID=2778369 RepID=A0A8J3N1T8_9CHLR|nr:hypothetical protein KSF_025780 [Reticulibacter mediterranei]